MSPRKVRIECPDGSPMSFRMIDAETGEDLRLPVSRCTWEIAAGQPGMATVCVEIVGADVVGELAGEESSWP